jgi:murein DD-endopeptidase
LTREARNLVQSIADSHDGRISKKVIRDNIEIVNRDRYTGQSTGPHLYFHVADSKMPLNAEGLPYVFQDFKTVGAFFSEEQFGEGRPWVAAEAKTHRLELPTAFSVVEFP